MPARSTRAPRDASHTRGPLTPTQERSSCALLIVDMISRWDFPDAEKLLPGAGTIAPQIEALARRCRAHDVPVIYANDNRGRWRSDFDALVQLSLEAGDEAAAITRRLVPDECDYFVLKPRQSAFMATPLELLLHDLSVRRLIVTGVASDQCVLVTATEARMRGFEVVVPADCTATQSEERQALFLQHCRLALDLPTPGGRHLRLPNGHKVRQPARVTG